MPKKEITREDVFKNNYLDIRLDVVFKAVFSMDSEDSKGALKAIIEAYTGQKVLEIRLLPNEIACVNQEEKQIRLDIYCIFNNGKKAIIEMALTQRKDECIRSEYYTAKSYSSQDTKGIRDYRDINPVYNITLIDKGYRFEEDTDPIHEFQYYDPKRNVFLGGKTRIITVELDKIESIHKNVKSMDSKERWGAFIKWINDENKRKEIEEIVNLEGGVKMALAALGTISKNEAMVWNAIRSEMKKVDWETQRNLDREEGKAEGEAKGRAEMATEKSIEIARNAIKAGAKNDFISTITGLTIQQIEKLRHQ